MYDLCGHGASFGSPQYKAGVSIVYTMLTLAAPQFGISNHNTHVHTMGTCTHACYSNNETTAGYVNSAWRAV